MAINFENKENPLFGDWTTPLDVPPFDRIKAAHFRPALQYGVEELKGEIEAIVAEKNAPTFENTLVALEKAESFLHRTAELFYRLEDTVLTKELANAKAENADLLNARDKIVFTNEILFEKVHAVYREQNKLTTPQRRVVEKYLRLFRQAGLGLSEETRAEIRDIYSKLFTLQRQFEDRTRSGKDSFALPLSTPEDKAGLSDSFLEAAQEAARERGFSTHALSLLFRLGLMSMLTFCVSVLIIVLKTANDE